jgi:hypothetical protein
VVSKSFGRAPRTEASNSFDTGASGTNLFVRYYNRFRGESSTWEKGESKRFGAGGLVKRKIYIQPQVNLGVGDKTVTLKKVPILSRVREQIRMTCTGI